MTVATLLEQSRTAHQRSKRERGEINERGSVKTAPRLVQAGALIAEALRWRLEAEALDPNHVDPAWLDDQQANRGQTSDAMVTFLGRYLTPAEARI